MKPRSQESWVYVIWGLRRRQDHRPLNPKLSPILIHGVSKEATRKVWRVTRKVFHWQKHWNFSPDFTVWIQIFSQSWYHRQQLILWWKKSCRLTFCFLSLCSSVLLCQFCYLFLLRQSWCNSKENFAFRQQAIFIFKNRRWSRTVCAFVGGYNLPIKITFTPKKNNNPSVCVCKDWSLSSIISVWWKLI